MSISRREFLKASGALVVTFSAASLPLPDAIAQGPFGAHPSHIDPSKLDSWIAVGGDGAVTAYTGKCDFGQVGGAAMRGPVPSRVTRKKAAVKSQAFIWLEDLARHFTPSGDVYACASWRPPVGGQSAGAFSMHANSGVTSVPPPVRLLLRPIP